MRKILTITNVVEVMPDGTTKLLTSNVTATEILDNGGLAENLVGSTQMYTRNNGVALLNSDEQKKSESKRILKQTGNFIMSEAMKKYNYIALGSKGAVTLEKGVAIEISADWLEMSMIRNTHRTQRNRIDKMNIITEHYQVGDNVTFYYEEDEATRKLVFK